MSNSSSEDETRPRQRQQKQAAPPQKQRYPSVDDDSSSDSDERQQVRMAQQRAKQIAKGQPAPQPPQPGPSAPVGTKGVVGPVGPGITSDGDDDGQRVKKHGHSSSHKTHGSKGVHGAQQGQQQVQGAQSGQVDVKNLLDANTGTGLLDGGKLKRDNEDDESDSESSENDGNCSICSYDLKNVVKLKCGHKFCYSCIKGHIIAKNKDCPYCQKALSGEFIKTLLTDPGKICKKVENFDSAVQYFWIYDSRGNNGWWNFDNKANQFLERDYQNWLLDPNRSYSAQKYTLMVCGTVMEIDFNDMVQINPVNGSSRKIDRVSVDDLKFMEKKGMIKGVAGINRKKDE